MPPFRLAMVSLDSSHCVEFTRLIQGDAPEGQTVAGLRVTTCCRFQSKFQPEKGQDERQAQLEAWGVALAPSLEDAVRDVDGMIVSLNDPADHWPVFQRVVGFGKPVFLDKPLADTVGNGEAIIRAAEKAGIPFWSSSSVPLLAPMAAARRAVPAPVFAHAFGPLGKAVAGSDIAWYGCHTFESLVAMMGPKAVSVRALEDSTGVTARIVYPDGRGVVELNRGHYAHGGRVADGTTARVFLYNGEPDFSAYLPLMEAMRDFFIFGRTALPPANAMAALRLGQAVEKSLEAGGRETAI